MLADDMRNVLAQARTNQRHCEYLKEQREKCQSDLFILSKCAGGTLSRSVVCLVAPAASRYRRAEHNGTPLENNGFLHQQSTGARERREEPEAAWGPFIDYAASGLMKSGPCATAPSGNAQTSWHCLKPLPTWMPVYAPGRKAIRCSHLRRRTGDPERLCRAVYDLNNQPSFRLSNLSYTGPTTMIVPPRVSCCRSSMRTSGRLS